MTPSPNPVPQRTVPAIEDVIAPPMPLLRQRIGLLPNDTTRDPDITQAWQIACAWAETYLNRFLRDGAYVEIFTHAWGVASVSLCAYPPTIIESITDENSVAVGDYHVDAETGLIYFDGRRGFHQLRVGYTVEVPDEPALTLALSALFSVTWSQTFDVGSTAAAGLVKATSIDGMRVEYDTGSALSIAASAGGIPAQIAFALNPFARLWA